MTYMVFIVNFFNRNFDRATFVSASFPELSKLLNEASSKGDTKEVSKLLANGASVQSLGVSLKCFVKKNDCF